QGIPGELRHLGRPAGGGRDPRGHAELGELCAVADGLGGEGRLPAGDDRVGLEREHGLARRHAFHRRGARALEGPVEERRRHERVAEAEGEHELCGRRLHGHDALGGARERRHGHAAVDDGGGCVGGRGGVGGLAARGGGRRGAAGEREQAER
ncbi:hypothetical protein FV284_24930, partial [Escherichia coli]